MEQVRQVFGYHHYSDRTEQSYCGWINDFQRPVRSKQLPAVFLKNEVRQILNRVDGIHLLILNKLYSL